MKTIKAIFYGIAFCAAGAVGVWSVWSMRADAPANAATVAQPRALALERVATVEHASGLWAWGNAGTRTGKMGEPVDVLLTKALRPSSTSVAGDDLRDKLRKLAQEDPVVMKQLMESYDKASNVQARQLIVALLSGIEKPEVLAFSKRLATSRDMTERKDGFNMLQNLSGDSPDLHPIILQALSGDKSPDVIMLALAALKPPAGAENNSPQANVQAADATAIVAQLQHLTGNADPNIRLQSILQLAQWDKADDSQVQWSQALADQSPQVRQAAVTAVAQSGTQSDAVKAALIGMANNPNESKDVRGNALQVLEGFALSKDEAANLSQLRAQILHL